MGDNIHKKNSDCFHFTNLNINLIITNHDSNEEILNKINACAKKAKFSLSILSLKDDKLAQEINPLQYFQTLMWFKKIILKF